MTRRASNCFSLAEIEALLTSVSAIEAGDRDKARRYAQSPAALQARRKLAAMRDKLRRGHGSNGHPRKRKGPALKPEAILEALDSVQKLAAKVRGEIEAFREPA